jgi:hypothetical protein
MLSLQPLIFEGGGRELGSNLLSYLNHLSTKNFFIERLVAGITANYYHLTHGACQLFSNTKALPLEVATLNPILCIKGGGIGYDSKKNSKQYTPKVLTRAIQSS